MLCGRIAQEIRAVPRNARVRLFRTRRAKPERQRMRSERRICRRLKQREATGIIFNSALALEILVHGIASATRSGNTECVGSVILCTDRGLPEIGGVVGIPVSILEYGPAQKITDPTHSVSRSRCRMRFRETNFSKEPKA